jgi:hypothetical protein
VYLPSWSYDHSVILNCFPNVRVSIAWSRLSGDKIRTIQSAGETPYRVDVAIHQPVHTSLVRTLLRCPQRWYEPLYNHRDDYTYPDPSEIPRPIEGISAVYVMATGSLLHEDELSNNRLLPENPVSYLRIAWQSRTVQDEARNTFRAIASIAPARVDERQTHCGLDHAMAKDYPVTSLSIEDGSGMDSFVQAVSIRSWSRDVTRSSPSVDLHCQLPFVVARQPRQLLKLDLRGQINFRTFQQYMTAVGKAYVQAWRHIEDRMTALGEEHVTFFKVEHKYFKLEETVDRQRKWEGWVFMHPGHTTSKPFTVAIMDYLDSDDEKHQACVFQKMFTVPKKRHAILGLS